MYYIFIENGKINGAGEARQLNDGIINYEVTQEIFEDFVNSPTKYVYKDEQIVLNENYDNEQAEIKRQYLIEEVNYGLKAKYAYTGVLFDYDGEELVFETNNNSIALINTTMLNLLTMPTMDKVSNWRCRKTYEPFLPMSVTFTAEQFKKIVAFAQDLIVRAFGVEDSVNLEINKLTTEQLLDEDFVNGIITNIQEAYSSLNIKIENLFEQEVQ